MHVTFQNCHWICFSEVSAHLEQLNFVKLFISDYLHALQASTSDVLQCPLTVVGALQDRRYTADQVMSLLLAICNI